MRLKIARIHRLRTISRSGAGGLSRITETSTIPRGLIDGTTRREAIRCIKREPYVQIQSDSEQSVVGQRRAQRVAYAGFVQQPVRVGLIWPVHDGHATGPGTGS